MFKTHQCSTCDHICLHSLQFEVQGIVINISIETSTRNQTAFVSQSLVSNTALLLWAADSGHLLNENSLKDLFSPGFCPGWSEEPMVYSCTPLELDPSTFESGIPLCCERGISSDGQEVA